MKRFISIIVASGILLLSSCASPQINPEKGLDAFHEANSEFSLCRYIMPNDFIGKFDYEDGNYYHSSHGFIYKENYIERVLIHMQYNDENYIDAKTHSLESLILSDEPIGVYNGYEFFLNKSSSNEGLNYLDGKYFPNKFLSFAYFCTFSNITSPKTFRQNI